ncbi:hypothetical protein [Ramlibacter humi]|uniref:Uncharacterized protein n=1 Tax=Ramlibacter humi TaxID=2530451 RepID=A0A4Z0BJB0_9BURK|nr:hypothetical protein [Ramlibacter humi]TFY98357.1 hypothetical protein EZ216_17370 [Ramlibacter humi]
MEELALVESAALHMESLEAAAERRFDSVHAEAVAAGDAERAKNTPELEQWLSAREQTDAAWSRWAQVMDAKPAA